MLSLKAVKSPYAPGTCQNNFASVSEIAVVSVIVMTIFFKKTGQRCRGITLPLTEDETPHDTIAFLKLRLFALM